MSHFISVAEAASMISLYRQQLPALLQPEFSDSNVLALAETFDRAAIDVLLNRTGCVALRIYYGMDDSNKIHAIIVGVNADNEDILPQPTNLSADTAYVLERAFRCPEFCPPPSQLTE